MIPERFIEFIKAIIVDGDWEYGDGTSMTKDAKIVLAEIQRWHTLATAMPDLACEQ